jgi:hypothetical protein
MSAAVPSVSDPEQTPLTPVVETLSAVAGEVRALAQLGDRLQALISVALVADSMTHVDHVREFQAIDLLAQRLHGVSSFIDALADGAPTEWTLDAAAAAAHITLSDLAKRLGGSAKASVTPAADPADMGDLELFG